MARTKQQFDNPPADGTLPQLTGMTVAANAMAAMQASYSDEQRQATQLIGERIGRRSMAQMISKLLTVTDLLDLQRIKESKQYKGFVHVDESGNRYSITTWDEYCRVVEGRSREAVDVDLNNLKQLGPELFDSMRRIGIGPGTMRDIRQLPEDEKAVIAEVVQTDNKDEIVELIDSLTAKHAKEKASAKQLIEALEKRVHETGADLEARGRLLAEKTANLNRVKEQLIKAQQHIQSLPPVDVGMQIRAEASMAVSKAEVTIRALVKAFQTLADHTNAHDISHADFMAGLLGQLQLTLNQLRSEFDIKAAPDGEEVPAWLLDAEPQLTADEDQLDLLTEAGIGA